MDAVEQYVLDEPAYTLEFHGMVPRDAAFTYKEMIDRHRQDREFVIEALSNPQCRLLRGAIRTDLSEICNAQAFFRYARFTEICQSVKGMDNDFRLSSNPHPNSQNQMSMYQIHLHQDKSLAESRSGKEGDFDRDLYHTLQDLRRKEVLRNVWLVSRKKCPSYVVNESLKPLNGDTGNEDLLKWWNEDIDAERRSRLELQAANFGWMPEKTRRWLDEVSVLERHELLNGIAARLGFEWLVIEEPQMLKVLNDSEYLESKFKLFPWMFELQFALNETSFSTSSEIDEPFGPIALAVVKMREDGYEADIKDIVNRLCSKESNLLDSRNDGCATAIKNAELALDPTSLKELRVLDEIDAMALKLNLYQEF